MRQSYFKNSPHGDPDFATGYKVAQRLGDHVTNDQFAAAYADMGFTPVAP